MIEPYPRVKKTITTTTTTTTTKTEKKNPQGMLSDPK